MCQRPRCKCAWLGLCQRSRQGLYAIVWYMSKSHCRWDPRQVASMPAACKRRSSAHFWTPSPAARSSSSMQPRLMSGATPWPSTCPLLLLQPAPQTLQRSMSRASLGACGGLTRSGEGRTTPFVKLLARLSEWSAACEGLG